MPNTRSRVWEYFSVDESRNKACCTQKIKDNGKPCSKEYEFYTSEACKALKTANGNDMHATSVNARL